MESTGAVKITRDADRPLAERVIRPDAGGERRIVKALVGAFETDPVANWMLRKDGRRREAFDLFFKTGLSFCLMNGEVFHDRNYPGASLWFSERKWEVGYLQQARFTPDMVKALSLGGVFPFLKALRFMENSHPHERHYYLQILGVDPVHQGKGVGAALLKPMLDRCDHEGCGAYLENSNPRNLDFYIRQGFRVINEMRLGKGSPPLWRMWRAPGDGRSSSS
jgi:GNAT superfamily N-acetyltransferase